MVRTTVYVLLLLHLLDISLFFVIDIFSFILILDYYIFELFHLPNLLLLPVQFEQSILSTNVFVILLHIINEQLPMIYISVDRGLSTLGKLIDEVDGVLHLVNLLLSLVGVEVV
jgi:hypothetical protein